MIRGKQLLAYLQTLSEEQLENPVVDIGMSDDDTVIMNFDVEFNRYQVGCGECEQAHWVFAIMPKDEEEPKKPTLTCLPGGKD